jgi:hypothetical protein
LLGGEAASSGKDKDKAHQRDCELNAGSQCDPSAHVHNLTLPFDFGHTCSGNWMRDCRIVEDQSRIGTKNAMD